VYIHCANGKEGRQVQIVICGTDHRPVDNYWQETRSCWSLQELVQAGGEV